MFVSTRLGGTVYEGGYLLKKRSKLVLFGLGRSVWVDKVGANTFLQNDHQHLELLLPVLDLPAQLVLQG